MVSAFPARGSASPRSAKISAIKAATLAFILVLVICQIALAGKGNISISGITDNGNGSYTLTVNSTSGMTVGDHVGARTGSSTGPGGVWEVMSIPSGVSVIVSDTLTEENGTAFGLPQTGTAWFSTPTANTDLSRPPHNAVAYDAALRRNYYLVDSRQPLDSDLTVLAGLAKTDGNFIVGDGSNWTVESGATARTSLGLTIGTNVQAYDAQLADVAGLTPTDDGVIIGNGTNFVVESGATLKTSLGLTIGTNVQAYDAELSEIAALSPSKGDILVYNGTDWGILAASSGTNGQVLKLDSTEPAGVEWEPDNDSGGGGGSPHDLLDGTVNQDTLAATVSRGSIIVGNSTPKWAEVTAGAAGTIVASDGTDTAFRTLTAVINANVTEAQGDILYYNGTNWVSLPAGTADQALTSLGASANPAYRTVIDPGTAGGRITTVQDTPASDTDTPSATLWYEAYVGDQIALYDGTSWRLFDISAGPDLDVSALTADKNYDVFCYSNSGTADLEASAAWTTDTTRSDALALQDGVLVKSGAATRRYVGTIRTVSSTGTKAVDSQAQRFVWNYQNRIAGGTKRQDATASWTVAFNTSIRGMNNGDADWKHEFVNGGIAPEERLTVRIHTRFVAGSAVTQLGIGYDTIASTDTTNSNQSTIPAGYQAWATIEWCDAPAIGYHFAQGVELGVGGSGNATFVGGVEGYMVTDWRR